MINLKLIEPTIELENEYLQMLNEWQKTGEKLIPFVLKMDISDFPGMVEKLKKYSHGIDIPDNFVPHSTYWLINKNNRILGVVNIRPTLNESLLQRGGHIGYGIRPSERRKGYATEMLRLALLTTKSMGIDRVLITCDKDNIGSSKTIINNGGVIESEEIVDGVMIQRFWISL